MPIGHRIFYDEISTESAETTTRLSELLAAVGYGFVDVVRVSIIILGIAAEIGREIFTDLLAELIKPLLRSLDFVVAYQLTWDTAC